LGRFAGRDPIGSIGGVNNFAYARHLPVDHLDPTGLVTVEEKNALLTRCGSIKEGFKPPGAIGSLLLEGLELLDPDGPLVSPLPLKQRDECEDRLKKCLVKGTPARFYHNMVYAKCGKDFKLEYECNKCNTSGEAFVTRTPKDPRKEMTGATIHLCWNNLRGTEYANFTGSFVTHELLHVLQHCTGKNAALNCEDDLKREVEAYYCQFKYYPGIPGVPKEPSFYFIYEKAIESSCRQEYCTPPKIFLNYEKVEKWFEDNKKDLCTFEE
jgi:hypothetical protein